MDRRWGCGLALAVLVLSGCPTYTDVMGTEDDRGAPPHPDTDLLEIHLDNGTLDPVGYEAFALDGNPVTADEVTGIVAAAFPGHYIEECTAQLQFLRFWVCAEGIGDFAALAFVDGHSGTLVFAGSIVWAGTGDRMFPEPLLPASDLSWNAEQPAPLPVTLAQVEGISDPGEQADDAVDAVRQMGHVVDWLDGAEYDAVVHLHPYSVGAGDPAEWDYVVFLVKR